MVLSAFKSGILRWPMWYKFEDENSIGIPRIKNYQVAFYDMTR